MVHLTTHNNNNTSLPLLQEPGFLRNAVAYYRLLATWLLRMAHPPLAQGQMPHVPLPEPVPVQFRCLPVRAASWQASCPAKHCAPAWAVQSVSCVGCSGKGQGDLVFRFVFKSIPTAASCCVSQASQCATHSAIMSIPLHSMPELTCSPRVSMGIPRLCSFALVLMHVCASDFSNQHVSCASHAA